MARQFNSVITNYLDCGDPAGGQITGTDITISCWVKPLGSSACDVFGKWGIATNTHEWTLGWGSGQFSSGIKNGTGAGGYSLITGASVVPLGRWYHVAIRQDATTHSLVLNGKTDGTNGAVSINDNGNTLLLGRKHDTGVGNAFNGLLRDFAVWDQPLTNQELMLLAMGHRPDTIRTGRLRTYYELNHFPGEYDKSGRYQPATMQGAVPVVVGDEPEALFRKDRLLPIGQVVTSGIDADTVYLKLTPSSADVQDIHEFGTVRLSLRPSSSDVAVQSDHATVKLNLTPVSLDEYFHFCFNGEGNADVRFYASDVESRFEVDPQSPSPRFTARVHSGAQFC